MSERSLAACDSLSVVTAFLRSFETVFSRLAMVFFWAVVSFSSFDTRLAKALNSRSPDPLPVAPADSIKHAQMAVIVIAHFIR